jgi:hypothetical protein
MKGSNTKGIHRMSWNFLTASTATISIKNINSKRRGNMVGPGMYTAQIFKKIAGKYSAIGNNVSFEVKQFHKNSLEGSSADKVVAHWEKIASISVKTSDLERDIKETKNGIQIMLKAYDKAKLSDESLLEALLKSRDQILALEQEFGGSKARSEVGEKNEYPTLRNYIRSASSYGTTYGPTKAQLSYFNNANKLFNIMTNKLDALRELIAPFEKRLEKIGAPKIKR